MYFYDRCERRVDEKYVEGTSVRFHDSLFTVSDARAPATRKNILLSAASIRRDGHHGRHKAPHAMVSSSAATNCSPMFVDQVPKISEIRRAIFYPVAADASHPHALRDRSDSTLKLILFYFATPSSLPFPSIIEKFPNLRRHEKTASWILLSDGNSAFFFPLDISFPFFLYLRISAYRSCRVYSRRCTCARQNIKITTVSMVYKR